MESLITGGGGNVGIGENTAFWNQTGSGNTIAGTSAAFGTQGSSFSNDSVFGFQSGTALSTGSGNLFLGYEVASTTQTGSNNIALGYNIDLPSLNGTNQLDIGNLIYGTGVNGSYGTLSSGNIGIATTTPWGRLSITGVDTSATTPGFVVADSNNNALFNVMDSGNVGIANVSPNFPLDVGGNVNVAGGFGYNIKGQLTLYASSSLSNLDIGYLAGAATTTTGSGNIAIGLSALGNDTVGGANIGIGNLAGLGFSNGTTNVLVGTQVMQLDGGSSNVALGYEALQGNFSNTYNDVVLGYQAGYKTSSGSDNILIGYEAASTTQTGSNNIALGYNIDLPSLNGSNQLDIGNLIYGTGVNGSLASLSSGNIGIGTTTPYSKLEVWGPDSASTTAFSVVNNASTTVFAAYDNGNATYSGSIFQSSDQRLKTNINDLDSSTTLALVDQLNPVSYTRIDQPDQGTNLGFIAQAVQQIFPELVSTSSPTALTPDGTLTLNYQGLIAPLVKAVQALSTEITSLQNTITGFANSFTTGQLTYNSATGSELTTQQISSSQITTNQLCVNKSDGTPVCISGDQIAAVLAFANQSAPSASISSENDASSTPNIPPVISINGNNPATIQVGGPYTDLGASITGPQQDINLDINTYVNGVLMNPIQLDTNEVATDTIDYVVTDQNGLTSTSTRTVVIEAATSSESGL